MVNWLPQTKGLQTGPLLSTCLPDCVNNYVPAFMVDRLAGQNTLTALSHIEATLFLVTPYYLPHTLNKAQSLLSRFATVWGTKTSCFIVRSWVTLTKVIKLQFKVFILNRCCSIQALTARAEIQ